MGGNIIEQHNFENAKNELKKFSEQTTTELELKRVDNSKGVGEFLGDWFLGRGLGLSHKVTGEEFNELTTQIQNHLRSVNNTQIKLIKEFGQVYTALEALDNDYIKAILISIKATEETSQSIQVTQEQIKKIVDNQRKTLEELKKFKQKLDGYAHLEDIDKIWNEYQKLNKEVDMLSKNVKDVGEKSKEGIKKIDILRTALSESEKKIEELSKQYNDLKCKLELVSEFIVTLESIIHLKDVDEMWESISSVHNDLSDIGNEIESIRNTMLENKDNINVLIDFMEKLLGIQHLMKVDDIWKQMKESQTLIDKLECANRMQIDKITKLEEVEEQISKSIYLNKEDIADLKEYKSKLSMIAHLEDVDSIWKQVDDYTSRIVEYEKKNEMLITICKKNKEDIDKKIADVIQENSSNVEELSNRVKYAYWIAGGSAGLAIIEFILLLMKVI